MFYSSPRVTSTQTPLNQHRFRLGAVVAMSLVLGACANGGGNLATMVANGGLDNVINIGGTALKALNLSDSEVVGLSNSSCAEMDKASKIAGPKTAYAKRLAKLTNGLPKTVNGVVLNYKVYADKEVNAWAMANGCVRVYSGLMDMMSDDEVRGVIGHEIGHVSLGHSKKAMQVAYGANAARQAALASGNATVASLSGSALGELAEKLVNAQFSQNQESAADDFAFDTLTAAKLKQDGLITAFEKLAKLGDSKSLLSSHPSSAGRAQHIRDRIAAGK